jgi:retron-type reverse transcriptase
MLRLAHWYSFRRRIDRADASAPAAEDGPAATLPTLEQVVDVGNLLRALEGLQRDGGQAPGVDGVRPRDLGRREGAAALRLVNEAALAGAYRPAPTRAVSIPKASGGRRTLQIGTAVDRTVAAALHHALTPVLDAAFLEGSHGFRPGRSPWTMLAHLEAAAHAEGRWVLVNDDIRRAFDSVPTAGVVDAHRDHVPDPRLLRLVEAVLRGHEAERRTRGIDQGSPHSPTALNVYLHHHHDLALQRDHLLRLWYRYADNLVYLVRSQAEGHQARQAVTDLLRSAGLALKGGDGAVVDLREGAATSLLGYTIRLDSDVLTYGLAEEAWDRLGEGLYLAHTTDHPPQAAKAAICGWVAQCGPALVNGSEADLTRRVLDMTRRYGFREISSQAVRRTCQRSRERWQKCHRAACNNRERQGAR